MEVVSGPLIVSAQGVDVRSDFIAAGGNSDPAAADWDLVSGLIAFGAGCNVALWDPAGQGNGVFDLLGGHEGSVTAVKFFHHEPSKADFLLSGAVDKTIRLWRKGLISCAESRVIKYEALNVIRDHEGSIKAFAVHAARGLFLSASADKTVRLWKVSMGQESEAGEAIVETKCLQSIDAIAGGIPLALALAPVQRSSGSLIMAAAGTVKSVHIWIIDPYDKLVRRAKLAGHDDWIRSLDFTQDPGGNGKDLLLASASQDKYVRLWRFRQGDDLPATTSISTSSSPVGSVQSTKAERFEVQGLKYSATFEALLLAHEDWIYTARWKLTPESLHLLSASADSSLAIYGPDPSTGIWVCIARLGEVSSQKGSTSATGGAGGFCSGLWSPDGTSVACVGRGGSWRRWTWDVATQQWIQQVAVTGHIDKVNDIAWASDGQYVLSTSSDQTTRLFAQWKTQEQSSWHEFSRPQIHGYDLNCIDTLGDSRFISGADEKLLRVFEEPVVVAELLQRLCGIKAPITLSHITSADMPVLGLSNKAVESESEQIKTGNGVNSSSIGDTTSGMQPHKAALDLQRPPFEDHLARQTLWPEREKLYGHGFEISAVSASHDGKVVATACLASSQEHAVIRLFDTSTWYEIKPPLVAHSMSIAQLRFSQDDLYLLSVGRDRQWVVFERCMDDQKPHYRAVASEPKAHSRQIFDASWAPQASAGENPRFFATASRDSLVKIWQLTKQPNGSISVDCAAKWKFAAPVTAIAFDTELFNGTVSFAVGLTNGTIEIHRFAADLSDHDHHALDRRILPSQGISQIAWRPSPPAILTETSDGNQGGGATQHLQCRWDLTIVAGPTAIHSTV